LGAGIAAVQGLRRIPAAATAVLTDAINLGLSKMAESCPSTIYARLAWLQAWHIRDETSSPAQAELVNAQFSQPFAAWWGDGATSSSDGQNFKADGRGQFAGQVNLKYGQEPGVQFYTHISDQYAPFHTKVINTTVRDATHVLDGLPDHESDLRIEEHYTDTAGFTDHMFTLDWIQNVELRRRVQIGLNKGEAKNAPARAVFLNRVAEIRDRSFEDQRYRASGLYLVVAAIVLWNTVTLDRAVQALRHSDKDIDDKLLPHLSQPGWEHINLTGDYIWRQSKHVDQGKFRPLRILAEAWRTILSIS
jgi:TnpA family transposase